MIDEDQLTDLSASETTRRIQWALLVSMFFSAFPFPVPGRPVLVAPALPVPAAALAPLPLAAGAAALALGCPARFPAAAVLSALVGDGCRLKTERETIDATTNRGDFSYFSFRSSPGLSVVQRTAIAWESMAKTCVEVSLERHIYETRRSTE